MLKACLKQVACGDDRVHKGIGHRLLSCPGGQVIKDGNVSGRRDTIFATKQITVKDFDFCAPLILPDEDF
jgi:hypothetical protein